MLLVLAAAALGGAIAAVAGFGIGSVLTPVLAARLGTAVAVAAVSIPHFAATLLRFWLIRSAVDRRVLLHFGILSAAGGLVGAILHSIIAARALSYAFAGLLIFAGTMSVTGRASRLRFRRRTAWVAGAVSGAFGGLVGNQGGIRSAALLGFGLDRRALVATSTATGLIVDAVRMPVYFFTYRAELWEIAGAVVLATVGVVAGTIAGTPMLKRIPERLFRTTLGCLLIALGLFMLITAIRA